MSRTLIGNFTSNLVKRFFTTRRKHIDKYEKSYKKKFTLHEKDKLQFMQNGYTEFPKFLTSKDVDEIYNRFYLPFLKGLVTVKGADMCEMNIKNGTTYQGTNPLECNVFNVMLPSLYFSEMRGNIFEQLTKQAVKQMYPRKDMVFDFDMFLCKKPGGDGVFANHQDLAYWPKNDLLDQTTCTFWLAIDHSTIENGCMHFVKGSHEYGLRKHLPINENRDEGHGLYVPLKHDDKITPVELEKGGVTMHNELVIHGSSGNKSQDSYRKAYTITYRTREVVDFERSIGFTHSHNDETNYDTFQ